MTPFVHERARDDADAVARHAGDAGAAYLAGGTTLLDLMKLDVLRPARIVDVSPLRSPDAAIEVHDDWIRIGAFTTMRQAAEHRQLQARLPVLVETLNLAASRQLRGMATLGGNVLQRTRCGYYRDVSWHACNRRSPGSGCAARDGTAWAHAVLGGSEDCIAIYPGDFAQALIALDASVELVGAGGAARMLPFAQLHRLPGKTPHLETNLAPGELIRAFRIPVMPWFARSRYVKVRDRASYEFALASAAIALDLDDGVVRDVRIALGGGATVPWRARNAEDFLRGRTLDARSAAQAADAAYLGASQRKDTVSRLDLGKVTLVRALLETARIEVKHG